jgi:hypothetical protein
VIVFGFLVALAGVTTAAGFAAYADGAEHPGTIASVLVAVMILLGGPPAGRPSRDGRDPYPGRRRGRSSGRAGDD